MNFFDALRVSSSGLSAQRVRMNLAANNLANINTTKTAEGGPYRRKMAVFASKPLEKPFGDTLNSRMTGKLSEVQVVGIVDDPRPPYTKYDPQHLDADKNGYVEMPNINLMEEMTNMISATRSYEANVTAIKASKDMALKALEIGK
ncbi:MAG: flagellar basal body rod protein FlgC [Deltaproteobacteria bacterium]|nr:flagellar basal body rod protein FlgC [Deltaproteobacteria bacterium]